jgi:hypothetical protein
VRRTLSVCLTIPIFLFILFLVIWPSDHPDTLFFEQSAVLHCLYYYTRMLIHRPFIPGVSSMVQSVSLTSFYFLACGHGSFDVSYLQDPQALGICAAAARACILVADTHRRRRPDHPLLFSQSGHTAPAEF